MAKIAVIHRTLGIGGGESVCFHILEALQNQHDIHLYALNSPDFDRLNGAFGTDVRDVTVHTSATLNRGIGLVDTIGEKMTGGEICTQAGLELAALSRRYSQQWEEFDLRISTHGELPLSPPAIQYIHHPFLNRWSDGGHFEIESWSGKILNWSYTIFSGATPDIVRQSELLTNSEWTADQIETLYGSRPKVVFPPISAEPFDGVPWQQRENGFVSVGRVSEDKQTHRAIEIIKRVRDRGYDVHLHVVGGMNSEKAYVRQIAKAGEVYDWVAIEDRLAQNDLFELIETHRWGLHTKPFEHFGMAVAEQVAGGAVPFVPNTGGQVEIVGGNSALCYESIDDAVMKICSCLESKKRVQEIKTRILNEGVDFEKEDFETEIRSHVAAKIYSG